MRADIPELLFPRREDFHAWLCKNADTSEGVWLAFGKTKDLVTLSANDALEEALCFGWIDGQMRSIDTSKYVKYFARRRDKSNWSEKNKKLVEALRKKKLMTVSGEAAVTIARKNGTWNTPKQEPVNAEQVKAFIIKLKGKSPAYENFISMSASVQSVYTRRYLSFKTEESRQRDFEKIIDRLNRNLKPM